MPWRDSLILRCPSWKQLLVTDPSKPVPGRLFTSTTRSLVAMSVGHSLVVGCRLPSPQGTGSRVHGLQYWQHVGSVVADPGLWSTGSIIVVLRLSCSMACGIFLD